MPTHDEELSRRMKPILRHVDHCPRSGTSWRDEGDDWWDQDPVPECSCGQASVAERLFASDFEGSLLEAELYGVVDHVLRLDPWEWDGEATWDWYDRSVEVYIENPIPSLTEEHLDGAAHRIRELLGFSLVWFHTHKRNDPACPGCPLRPRRPR